MNHESWTAAVKEATVARLLAKIKSDDSIDFQGKNECANGGFCLFSTVFFAETRDLVKLDFAQPVSISYFVSVGFCSNFAGR
jgi:hypothetical protein